MLMMALQNDSEALRIRRGMSPWRATSRRPRFAYAWGSACVHRNGIVAVIVSAWRCWPWWRCRSSAAELDVGESCTVVRQQKGRSVSRTVKLLSLTPSYFPDHWIKENTDRRTFASVAIDVEVDGTPATLRIRPYESPTVVNGLKLYAESERTWANTGDLGKIRGMAKAVRFSATGANERWVPFRLTFPIQNYRWRRAGRSPS